MCIIIVTDGASDPDHIEDYKFIWKSMIAQKTPLVCFKSGSDEIVGLNMIFVSNKDDHFMERVRKQVSEKFFCEQFNFNKCVFSGEF